MKTLERLRATDARRRCAVLGYVREQSIRPRSLIISNLRSAERTSAVIKDLDSCRCDCIIGFGFTGF